MKKQGITIFRRISVLIFSLITALGLIFIVITYLSTTQFYQASTQLLNKDVAAHIAEFTSPYELDKFNKKRADSVFYNAMVISPSIEVYFLDTTGKVMYYQAPDSVIKSWQLPLQHIQTYIAGGGAEFIKGPDPKYPGDPKIFSATEVRYRSKKIGYIYVILGSNEYQNVTQMFLQSHVGVRVLEIMAVIVLLSVVISILYVNRLQKRFDKVISVLKRYQKGDFSVRFGTKKKDEFAPVSEAFDQMADMLMANFDKLKKSEKERKDFIANISHDLRTPLAVAHGFTETMLVKMNGNAIDRKEQEAYTQQVFKKIVQIENMVMQLFELSKMDSVEFRPAKEPFIFSEILQELINASGITVERKQLHLTCISCEDPSWIYADIRMMERVIQNLLDNAIKYTPENGNIRISLNSDAGYLAVQLENEGKALDPDLHAWLNDHPPAGNGVIRPGGSGLGLTIVKKILTLHDYPFHAEAHVGKGNRFTIRMKIYHAGEAPPFQP